MTTAKDIARRFAPLTAPVGSVVAVRTSAPEVVLTYDDGPAHPGTPAVLGALAETGSSATFFVLLTRVRRAPDLTRDSLAAGHEIALHGIDHRAVTALPPGHAARYLRDARHELEDLTGSAVRWFRPPYGKQSMHTWRATKAAGMLPVMWGPSLRDSRAISDQERVASVLDRVQAGSIVLCHDHFADADDGAHDGTAPDVERGTLARRLISALDERGLRCVSLANALQHGTPARRAWFG